MLNFFEDLPHLKAKDNTVHDFIFYLAQNLIIIDHKEKSVEILGACFDERFKTEIAQELQDLKELAKSIKSDFVPKKSKQSREVSANCSDSEFEKKSAILTRRNQKRRDFSSGVVSAAFIWSAWRV